MRRYPGLEPFSEEYKEVFFARDSEKAELYELVKINRHVLIYAKSGIGKTSLINAGLKPMLDKDGIVSIKVRFLSYNPDFDNISPLEKLTLAITSNETVKKLLDINSLIKQISAEINTPWLVFKHLQYTAPKQKFILIFDQFEELFSYPTEDIEAFAKELSFIVNNFLPEYFNALEDKVFSKEIQLEDDLIDILYQPCNLKAVFSLRDDRLSGLNGLTKFIPDIQKIYYELKPLSQSMAKEALTKPALAKGDFDSPEFEFSEQALKKILDYLSQNGNSSVEPVQLQLIALELEEIASQRKNKEKIVIQENDLPEFKDIFRNFYSNVLISIGNNSQREAAQKLIEDFMIVNGQRMTLNKTFCLQYVSQQTLDSLTNRFHLLRVENISTGRAYELSHDTLLEPIVEVKKERQEEEHKKELTRRQRRQIKIISFISLLSLIFLALAIFGVVMWQKAILEQAKSKAKDAESYREMEKYMSAIGKYQEMFKIYKSYFGPVKKSKIKNVNDEIEQCKQLDSISRLFYGYMNRAMTLIERKDFDSIHNAFELYDKATKLDYDFAQKTFDKFETKLNIATDMLIQQANYALQAGGYGQIIARRNLELLNNYAPDNPKVVQLRKKLN